jgi:hypothetical protein
MRNDWPHGGAFVIQFGPNTDLSAGHMEGRVEHVATMRSTRFHSLGELLAFLKEALTAATWPRRQENGEV